MDSNLRGGFLYELQSSPLDVHEFGPETNRRELIFGLESR